MALGADEVVGVEHDFVKPLVPVQVTQVEQRQLRLSGQQQPALFGQLNPGHGGEVLGLQKQYAAVAQPFVLLVIQPVENAQMLAHVVPYVRRYRVLRKDSLAPPFT